MPKPGIGSKSFLQIAEEATYGASTPTALTKLEVMEYDYTIDQGLIEDPSLYDQISARDMFQLAVLYRGTIKFRANYAGLLKIMRAAFGSSSVSGSASTGYTHVFVPGTVAATGGVYSLAGQLLDAGIVDTGGDCTLITGMVITSLKMSGTAGKDVSAMCTFEITFIAKDITAATSTKLTAIGSFPAVVPIVFHHNTDSLNGTALSFANQRIKGFDVTLNSILSEDRHYLASKNIDEPIRDGMVSSEWVLREEFSSFDQWKAAQNSTTGVLKLVFTSPTDIPGATGGTKYLFTIDANKAKASTAVKPVRGYGRVEATTTWKTFFDATTGALRIQIKNDSATVAAANA
jgi:hypothetical protein